MLNRTAHRNLNAMSVLVLSVLLVLGCKLSSLSGVKMNMFEGTTARDGAEKIRKKLGIDDVKVSYIEIHADRMEVTVQDPAKPKNFDKYTYEKGAVSGPKPVEALVLGNQEFTADKSRLFSLSEINFDAIPETCRKAAERAQIEYGKPELISIDWQNASMRLSKEEKEKQRQDERDEFMRQSRSGKSADPMAAIRKRFSNLVPTWRIYIRGPHMSKDFWADEKGNLFEPNW